MGRKHWVRRLFFVLFIGVIAMSRFAYSQQATEYKPEVGQEGKDVVWVPTPQALVEKMLDMAKVTSKDYLIDLGSGDGRTVITAAKRGVRAHGIEYNPDMVELSKRNAAKEKVGEKATFVKADLFKSDFSHASVITMFLLPEINLKLRPRILNLKPGTRIVSNSFDMGEWTPDETASVSEGCDSWCEAYLWIVPAKVAGTWNLQQGNLRLAQSFQYINGNFKSGNVIEPIKNGRLNGDRISFTAGRARYTGRVRGNVIEGTISTGARWKATRVGK